MAFEKPETLPDLDRWIYEDSSETAIDFREKLKWAKIGFIWAMSLSDQQRRVAYRRIFLNEKFFSIASDLDISPSTARTYWANAVKKGMELMSEDGDLA